MHVIEECGREGCFRKPFFSIIIPTYNSEKTLEYTLQSIKNQSIDDSEVEIIVVDGGSTDLTREIANRYGAIVLDNPRTIPENAKAIGMTYARGVFSVRMDSDEEFAYDKQLEERMLYLRQHPEIKMYIQDRYASGRKDLCGISSEYINILGDPFSYFVYKTKFTKCETYKKNIVSTEGKFNIMRFQKGDVFPLADSGTCMLNIDFMREKYASEYNSIDFICQAYDRVLYDTELCGCIEGDIIRHNCNSGLKTYLSKLKFRVINNLFCKKESGFSSKEELSGSLKRRKILFCLYATLLPIPILDSIRMAIKYKRGSYLLHFVYLYYVCFQILYFGILKVIGKEVANRTYAK